MMQFRPLSLTPGTNVIARRTRRGEKHAADDYNTFPGMVIASPSRWRAPVADGSSKRPCSPRKPTMDELDTLQSLLPRLATYRERPAVLALTKEDTEQWTYAKIA